MEANYGVFIDQGPVAGHLQLMRWLVQRGSCSTPHLTVRYANTHLPRWMKQVYEETVLTTLNLESASTFDVEGWEERSIETAFLTSLSSELESLSYKPDYPDTMFHLSIYAGERSRLAYYALREMKEFAWKLTLRVPPSRLETFRKHKERQARLGNTGLLPEARETLYRLTNASMSIDLLSATLSDPERIDLLRTLCRELHNMPQVETTSRAELPPLFEDAEVSPPGLDQSPQGFLFSRDEIAGAAIDRAEMRSSGTYITPPEVASEMVRCALDYLQGDDPIEFLDPTLGSGILYAQLLRLVREQDRTIGAAVGIEKNLQRAMRTEMKFVSEGLRVFPGDFMQVRPTDLGGVSGSCKFNLLVANPPYYRPSSTDSKYWAELRGWLSHRLGVMIPATANAYVYFVLSSIQWLREGAISAWLLPKDVLFSSSSRSMRRYLAQHESILRVHEYSDLDRFQAARVSQVLLVTRHSRPSADHHVEFTGGELRDSSARRVPMMQTSLVNSARWSLPARSTSRGFGVRFGDIFDVRRGIATGANSAFTLADDDLERVGPAFEELLTPILPKARYIHSDVVRADINGFPLVDRRLWLINTGLPLTRIFDLSPWLGSKLVEIQRDYGLRTLLARRHPFYLQERQERPVFAFVTMARCASETPPRRFLLNLSEARVLNNYHSVRLKPGFDDYCKLEGVSRFRLLRMLAEVPLDAYLEAGRWYHSGLVKLEPGDLRRLQLRGRLGLLGRDYLERTLREQC